MKPPHSHDGSDNLIPVGTESTRGGGRVPKHGPNRTADRDPLITIVTFTATGRRIDTATATTPEQAVAAARVLMREARNRANEPPTCSFYADGFLVRSNLTAVDLGGLL